MPDDPTPASSGRGRGSVEALVGTVLGRYKDRDRIAAELESRLSEQREHWPWLAAYRSLCGLGSANGRVTGRVAVIVRRLARTVIAGLEAERIHTSSERAIIDTAKALRRLEIFDHEQIFALLPMSEHWLSKRSFALAKQLVPLFREAGVISRERLLALVGPTIERRKVPREVRIECATLLGSVLLRDDPLLQQVVVDSSMLDRQFTLSRRACGGRRMLRPSRLRRGTAGAKRRPDGARRHRKALADGSRDDRVRAHRTRGGEREAA